jgi:UDP-N-acetylglucosamine diphosphorylase / glucose-1-phosphate thymidylyltransferase / UDP-N-acetylgalactosamine diphosphorylase / glucosamine-1-phosphate N-acetyltransferase / galactosamine-1-phosphate N-acetyltransferase
MHHSIVSGNSAPRLCLFEDGSAHGFEPLALTRPVFDLLCGRTSLAAKQARCFPGSSLGMLVRPYLADVCKQQHPDAAVNDAAWLRAGPTVFVNARWLPTDLAADTSEPGVALIEDEVAYAVVDADRAASCTPETLDDCLESWKPTLPRRAAGGRLVRHLWELVDCNAVQLELDCRFLERTWSGRAGLAVVGPIERLFVDPSARVDPMVVADTTRGSVVIDREAVVTAFTRLEGPCYVGPHAQLLGAKVRGGTTLGPHCRVGGEVEASILQGYTNKYHDGFLGHAYVGSWVNLGAGTSNSDLRNDYGEVNVVVEGRLTPTGLTKVGCFIGDHTKAGLGTLLNTGTNVGAYCNLLPSGGFLPKYVPSFCSWWNGALVDRADPAALVRTAEEVAGRRGVTLTEADAALALHLFDETAAERRRALREAEQRRLRRIA